MSYQKIIDLYNNCLESLRPKFIYFVCPICGYKEILNPYFESHMKYKHKWNEEKIDNYEFDFELK